MAFHDSIKNKIIYQQVSLRESIRKITNLIFNKTQNTHNQQQLTYKYTITRNKIKNNTNYHEA